MSLLFTAERWSSVQRFGKISGDFIVEQLGFAMDSAGKAQKGRGKMGEANYEEAVAVLPA